MFDSVQSVKNYCDAKHDQFTPGTCPYIYIFFFYTEFGESFNKQPIRSCAERCSDVES